MASNFSIPASFQSAIGKRYPSRSKSHLLSRSLRKGYLALCGISMTTFCWWHNEDKMVTEFLHQQCLNISNLSPTLSPRLVRYHGCLFYLIYLRNIFLVNIHNEKFFLWIFFLGILYLFDEIWIIELMTYSDVQWLVVSYTASYA